MSKTVRIIDFSVLNAADLKGLIGPFFKLFKGYKLKYTDKLISTPDDNLDDLKLPELSSSEERRDFAGKDAVAALTDKHTDILWLYRGGDPKNVNKSTKIIFEMIYAIHRNSIHLYGDKLNDFVPKPLIGYCLPIAIPLYLSVRGLAKAVHGANAPEWNGGISDKLVPIYENIFDPNYQEQHIRDLRLENQAAVSMLDKETEISGLIIGGLLQLISHAFLNGEQLKDMVGIKNVIRNQPIILFVELFVIQDEAGNARELFKFIAEHQIQIKALAIGHVSEPKKVEKVKNEICHVANLHNIPVVSGLNVGHKANQTPYLMARATIKFDKTIGALRVCYDKDPKKQTLGLLKDVKPELMWNRNELEKANIQPPQENVTSVSSLCIIL